MVAASKRLQHATLHAGGFHPLLADAKEGDVVYCDPPYAKVTETSFIEYNAAGFSHHDHRMLATAAQQAADRGATVLISNSVLTLLGSNKFELPSSPRGRTLTAKELSVRSVANVVII